MSDEELELTWRVGKGDEPGECTEPPPYKAYFCLKWGDEIIDHREFTKAELKEEVTRLHQAGERPAEYEQAFKELSSLR